MLQLKKVICPVQSIEDVNDPIEQLRQRLGRLDRQQIIAWQQMSPVQRLQVAFQAYQFVLEAVRLTERQRYPDLSVEEFNWRVTRRMQGNQKLGREDDIVAYNDTKQPVGI